MEWCDGEKGTARVAAGLCGGSLILRTPEAISHSQSKQYLEAKQKRTAASCGPQNHYTLPKVMY